MNNEFFIQTLTHYCDTVWEYNIKTKEFFIHHDKIAHELENGSYSIKELIDIYREQYLLDTNEYNWNHYFNRQYLNDFLRSENNTQNFQIRFQIDNSVPLWYSFSLNKSGTGSIILSGKDISYEIEQSALYQSSKNAFDNILNIDVESGTYIVIHSSRMPTSPIEEHNYNIMMERFFNKFSANEDPSQDIENMRLENIIRALEYKDEYEVFFSLSEDTENGKDIYYKKAIFTYADNEKRYITQARLDVSGLVRRYERQINLIKKENYRDKLTGAHNRNFYELNLKYRPIFGGVAVIDIDDFKLCNDTYGHSIGDLALIRISNIIKEHIDDQDMIIRHGGDEFLLIMPDADAESFENTLKQIQHEIENISIKGCQNLKLTVSIGGIIAKNEICSTAVHRADRYMYRAKNRKNTLCTDHMFTTDRLPESSNTPESLKPRILIVDDSNLNRMMLKEILKNDFNISEAADGAACLSFIEQHKDDISLILLDIIMPVMNGFEVLSEMNRTNVIEDIPVIMISVDDSDKNIRKAYDMGATDYISRPFDSKVIYRRVLNTVKLYNKQNRLIQMISKESSEREKVSRMMIDIFGGISGLLSSENTSHIQHIRKITSLLLDRLMLKTDKYPLSLQDCNIISTAAAFHDIGKIGIDSSIINKPDKLTESEYETVKQHTVIGESMLRKLKKYKDEPLLKTAADICRWHHERYDGNGYPDGLCGDQIPISAQVVSMADVFDALISKRSYKSAFSPDDAIKMIADGKCGTFNPLLVECLKAIKTKLIKEVYND